MEYKLCFCDNYCFDYDMFWRVTTIVFQFLGFLVSFWIAFYVFNKTKAKEDKYKLAEKEDVLSKTISLYEFSLNAIQEGIEKQNIDLTNFCDSLSNVNDEFVSPIFNSNISTEFLKDIDHKIILLGYRKDSLKFDEFKEVFSGLRFLEKYEDNFIDKVKYFRENYSKYEREFLSYNDLFTLYDEFIAEHIRNNGMDDSILDDGFLYSFGLLIRSCVDNINILNAGLMIDRSLFVEEFVKPLQELVKPLVTTDIRANAVFVKTNLVLDARSNILNFKQSIKRSFEKDIETLGNIKTSIINLIN